MGKFHGSKGANLPDSFATVARQANRQKPRADSGRPDMNATDYETTYRQRLEDPHPLGFTWPCGHPRTEANTQSVGDAGVRCRLCRRKINRLSAQRRAAEARP